MIAILYVGEPSSKKLLAGALGKDVVALPNATTPALLKTSATIWMAGGAPAVKAFREAGLLPKGRQRTLGWYRGQVFQPDDYPDRRVMVTQTPDSIRYDLSIFSDVGRDVFLARRFLSTGDVSPTLGRYEWVSDLGGVRRYVEARIASDGRCELSLDLETEGLDPFDPSKRILTVSASAEAGISDVVDLRDLMPDGLERLLNDLRFFLTDPRVYLVGANFKFDMLWLRIKFGLICENLQFDTCQGGSLLDENRRNSLSNHTFDYAPELAGYDYPLERTYDKSRMDSVPSTDLLPYCLSGNSLIQLGDGSWAPIKRIVLDEYRGDVMSFDGNGLVPKRVTGWHRTPGFDGNWLRIKTKDGPNGRWGTLGPRFTPEHEVYTRRGLVAVQDLQKSFDAVLDGSADLTPDQRSIVLGSLLGDGGFTEKNGKGVGFGWSQAPERAGYAQWKADALRHWEPRLRGDGRWATAFAPTFASLERRFARKNIGCHRYRKLVVTPDVLSALGALGLAVWIQDDGCAERSNGDVSAVRLIARKLDDEERGHVLAWLSHFGLNARYNNQQGFFRFGPTELPRLMEIIGPWVHPQCAYKFPKGSWGCGAVDTTWIPHASEVVDVAPAPYAPKTDGAGVRYCITVEDTHNFLTRVGIVANCGGDTDSCLRVARAQRRELAERSRTPTGGIARKSLASVYVNVVRPTQHLLHEIETGGILVDVERFHALGESWRKQILDVRAEAAGYLTSSLVKKHGLEYDGAGRALAPLSKPRLIIDALFSPSGLNLPPVMTSEKAKLPSTAEQHLRMFSSHPEAGPLVDCYLRHAKLAKIHSTYYEGFAKHLRNDGRWHPTYATHRAGADDGGPAGTVSGRASASDPAIQCLDGNSRVLTSVGWLAIRSVVSRCEGGEHLSVLTHTGEWRAVISTYRNGTKPVFDVSSESGKMLRSTANHPYLTRRGWVRTDKLREGDACFEYEEKREQREVRKAARINQNPDLLLMGCDEESLSVINEQGLASLWRARDYSMRPLAEIRGLSRGHGDEAWQELVYRENKQRRELRAGELCLGAGDAAATQSAQHEVDYARRRDSYRGGVGTKGWYQPGAAALPPLDRDSDGGSFAPGSVLEQGLFQEGRIVSVTPAGVAETFDLTIEGAHSFIAEGLVVHNTLPKRSDLAKPLRDCIVAPEGYGILSRDYSQGELRVAACWAPEPRMIEAYANGMDLHVLTPATMRGISYEEAAAWKESDPDAHKEIRRTGKVCIAEGSPVLTDRGLVPIERVLETDRVWDGIEWVRHEGVVYRGRRGVIERDGVTGTPDHIVYLENGERTFLVNAGASAPERRIARTEIDGRAVNLPAGYDSLVSERDERQAVAPAVLKMRVYDIANAGPRHRFTVSGRLVANCNFGLVYGLRANGLVHYAKALFDMDLTLDEAVEMRDGFFGTYTSLLEWHNREIFLASTRGYSESPLGRRRHLPLITSQDYRVAGHEKNKAINFPIQSCLGDMMWWAMSRVLEEGSWLIPFGQIHDNGLWYYPLDREQEALDLTGEVMGNLPFEEAFGWRPPLKFESDAEIGLRLGSMTEL